jgi:hypothetical protein
LSQQPLEQESQRAKVDVAGPAFDPQGEDRAMVGRVLAIGHGAASADTAAAAAFTLG